MTDIADRAAEVEQMQRDIALRKQRERMIHQESASYCKDCGEPISEQRRLLRGVVRCVACQGGHERRIRKFRT